MSIQARIEEKLTASLAAERLLVVNESHKHSGPATESHFNVICVSQTFDGQSRVQRQRTVNKLLQPEFDDGMHALTMKLLTPAEWDAAGGEVTNPAPPCKGGSKK
jgi:BolA protein